ncbi:MAG: hypothetical protein ACMUIE_10215, partial [Thermoplasmatota archaeon]
MRMDFHLDGAPMYKRTIVTLTGLLLILVSVPMLLESVSAASPVITDNTSTTATTGDSFTFTADVTDSDGDLSTVYVDRYFGTGSMNTFNLNLSSGNTYTYTITIP